MAQGGRLLGWCGVGLGEGRAGGGGLTVVELFGLGLYEWEGVRKGARLMTYHVGRCFTAGTGWDGINGWMRWPAE